MNFLRFGVVVSVLSCLLMFPAFAAEPGYSYEFSDGNFLPEQVTISYVGDVITAQLEDALFDSLGVSREVALQMFFLIEWNMTLDDKEISGYSFDWSAGSLSFPYSGDGRYEVFSDRADFALSFVVARTSVPSDGVSMPSLLTIVSDVFAAFCGIVAVLAGVCALHPILLVGIVLGFVSVSIGLFRRISRT